MLAEIKGIFTSCIRRITTTPSLGTTTNMQHRATWPQHHVQDLRQLTAVSCTPEALSKSMLAEIKGIFTSCLRRITTTTSLGTTTNVQHLAPAPTLQDLTTHDFCFQHNLKKSADDLHLERNRTVLLDDVDIARDQSDAAEVLGVQQGCFDVLASLGQQ